MTINRSIARIERMLKNKPSWIKDKIDDLLRWWRHILPSEYYYNLKNFFKNLPMFLRLAWKWRGWDSVYSIDAFASLLEAQGRACKNGHSINGVKDYRRALTAAGMLRKAYLDDYQDKTLTYLFKKNPMFFKDIPNSGYMTLEHEENTPKHIYDAMSKIAKNRQARIEAERKKEVWEYIHKYIEGWWD